ncbi:MAG: hypothetical protein ABIB79_01200 [archaeon]
MSHKNKKAVSGVIVTILLVLISLILVSVVWGVINNLVNKGLDESESCFGMFGKVTINPRYTCWNSTEGYLQLSLNIGNVNVDGVVIGVSSESGSRGYTLTNTDQVIPGLFNYTWGNTTKLPGKNGGLTYYINESSMAKPDSIVVVPVIGGNQCDDTDSLQDIGECNQFVF